MTTDLSERLRTLSAELADLTEGGEWPALERARDRLARDLLPRTAGGDASVVVGIVGPNNAGKSALFNALAGGAHSPSLPTGGATRRLVGAARPELAAELRAKPEWNRFRLQRLEGDASRPLENALDPSELLLVESGDVPDRVLLIDTPDFDSIARENRFASEALLAVADVVVAVVTRHSYQNAEVVDYLRRWLYHGRPWILVYNEAPTPEIVEGHARKLEQDVGSRPFAVYQAPHSLDVMEGRAPLAPTRTDDPSRTLARELSELSHVEELKRAALAASLGQLALDLRELESTLAERSEQAGALRVLVRERCHEAGTRIASRAMPGGPFLMAFREVLDRRSNRLSRRWRSGMKSLRLRLESVPRALFGGATVSDEEKLKGGLHAIERRELDRLWPGFYEELARDVGPEERHAARAEVPDELARALDADLGGDGGEGVERARDGLLELPVDFATFQAACEELVEKAIAERGFDWDIQAGADLATLLPVAVAAVVIVNTGGFGLDVGVAGGGVLTSMLFERYSALLGTGIAREAAKRWEVQRGSKLAELLLHAALPTAGPIADRLAERCSAAAESLSEHAEVFERESSGRSSASSALPGAEPSHR